MNRGAGYQDQTMGSLVDFISHKNFQKPFENFFLEHALKFSDDPEHQLNYTEIYAEFQSMFNEHMKEFQRQQGLDEHELMEKLKNAEDDDPRAAHYLKIIVASMEYDAFVKLMRQMRGRAKMLDAESKSEAKSTTMTTGGKGGDDSDDEEDSKSQPKPAAGKAEAKGARSESKPAKGGDDDGEGKAAK